MIKKVLIIVLLLFLAGGCGGAGEEQTPETVDRRATDVPPAVISAAPSPTLRPTATAAPTVTVTAASDPGPTLYTTDNNPCVRTLYPYAVLAPGGQQPLFLDSPPAGDELVARLPHPNLNFVAFVPTTTDQVVTHANPFEATMQDIRIWDARSGQELRRLSHDQGFDAPALSGGQPLMAAKAGDGQIWLWDLSDPADEGRVIPLPDNRYDALALSPDGRLLAVTTTATVPGDQLYGSWGVTLLYDTTTGAQVQRMEGQLLPETKTVVEDAVTIDMSRGHAGPIEWLGFTPNGQALLSISNIDNTMRLWDVASGEHLRCFELQNHGAANSASFGAAGQEIVTLNNNRILIWDTATSAVDRRLDPLEIKNVSYSSAVFSPGGANLVITASAEQAAYIWDSATGELQQLMRHPTFVNRAQMSPDGRLLVAIARDPLDSASAAAYVWDRHHVALSIAAEAQKLVVEGLEQGRQGDISAMLSALALAHELSPDDAVMLRPAVWEQACRYATIAGDSEDEACANVSP